MLSCLRYNLFSKSWGKYCCSQCNIVVNCYNIELYTQVLLQKEELEQQHLHLLQIVESEKTAKSLYTQQVEELSSEIRKLRAEVGYVMDMMFYCCTLSE